MTARPSFGSAVVTGGAGFIGSHLVEHLCAAGCRVTVVDDLSTGSRENLASTPADLVVADVADPSVAPVFASAEIVFHLAVRNVRASLTKPAENLAVNAAGTLAVLEAMRHGNRGRFVYLSSSEVYGDAPVEVFDEDVVPSPTTVYGAGKLAGEHVALAYHRSYGMDTRVVRPFNHYGPRSHFEGDSGEVIPKFVLRALAGRELVVHGDGSQTRDFSFVGDTPPWFVRIAEHPQLVGRTVNVGTGTEVSVSRLAQAVLAATGSRSTVRHGDPRPGDLPRLLAGTSRLRGVMPDFALPTVLEDGIAATIDWFRRFDAAALLEHEVSRTWD